MATKIRLSKEEKRLVRSEGFILTKNSILQKVMHLFGELKQDLDEHLKGVTLPEATADAKIARGENYQGLPWVMLDHPRYFTKTEVMAIRSFFWWGHYFSITLHLSGMPKEKAIPQLLLHYKALRKAGFLLCVNEDPWQHDAGKKNYRSLKKMSEQRYREIVSTKSFVKLSICFKLEKWERSRKRMNQAFSELILIADLA